MATTTHTHTFSEHDAALIAAKKDAAAESDARGKTWRAYLFNDSQAAASYANTSPPQGPGEIVFSVLPDGKVWVFPYF